MNDNLSIKTSITKNFNILKNEVKKYDDDKTIDIDFDNISMYSRNSIITKSLFTNNINDLLSGNISSLSKENLNSFLKKCDKRILIHLDLIYDKIINKSKNSGDNKGGKILFIAIFKQMLLDIGFSLKKFYDDSVRRITMNISFSTFVSCFESIFSLESNYSFYKYKSKLNNIINNSSVISYLILTK